MMSDDGMDEKKSKMETLMEIVKLMKQLQGDHAKGEPKGMEVEVSAHKLSPMDPEALHDESMEDPKEESLESPSEEHEEDSMESRPGMEIPEGLKKLLLEKLAK